MCTSSREIREMLDHQVSVDHLDEECLVPRFGYNYLGNSDEQ